MIFKWFLPSTDIIRDPRLPPSGLAPSSPTKVQHLWLSASSPTASYTAPPKKLNHIIVVMRKSCCPNYGSFHVLISELLVLILAGKIQ